MATWVTHLMIADGVLKRIPSLDRRGFCVGNIAPDCNVENEELSAAGANMDETWDSVKSLIPKKDRMREIYAMEAEYLNDHPNSGYLTEILPLKSFPDYIDYLPRGCIVRKIGVMGYLPEPDKTINKFIAVSKDEYANFVKDTIQLVVQQFAEKNLM